MKLSPGEKEQFFHQLGNQVGSGIPVLRALEKLSTSRRSKSARIAAKLLEREGDLQERFAHCGDTFSGMDLGMIEAGERGGTLKEVFSLLSDYYRSVSKARAAIVARSIYPMLVFHLAAVLLALPAAVAANSSVVFFQSAGTALGLFYLAMIAVYIFFRVLFSLTKKVVSLDVLVMRIPILGNWYRNSVGARFASVLSIQIQAGNGALSGLRPASTASGSAAIRNASENIVHEVRDGKSLASAFSAAGIFPLILEETISTGEETGRLDSELFRAASTLREQQQQALNLLAEWFPRLLYFAIILYTAHRIFHLASGVYTSMESMLDM